MDTDTLTPPSGGSNVKSEDKYDPEIMIRILGSELTNVRFRYHQDMAIMREEIERKNKEIEHLRDAVFYLREELMFRTRREE